MELSLFLIALTGICDIVFGAQKIEVKERVKRNLNIFTRRHRRSVETAADDLLGLSKYEQLKPQETMETADNTVKIKYIEEYKGLPVIGEAIVLELTSDGQLTGDASGSLLEKIVEDVPSVIPMLSEEQAFAIAALETGRNPDQIKFRPDDIKLAIYTINKNRENENDERRKVKAVLVYQVIISIIDPHWPLEIQVTIDANSGKVLHKNNLLETYGLKRCNRNQRMMDIQSVGGNEKIGAYRYGKDRESLQVFTEDGIICKMQNDRVAVVHLNFTNDAIDLDKNTTEGYEFECLKGVNDSINGGYSPLSDAYAYFNNVYDMFEEWYNTKPLKHRAVIAVHFSKNYENAFYMSQSNVMCIGDGKDKLYPLVEAGILAHEICHGFTAYHSDLEYARQSGGINEAFSDMASEAAQAYLSSKSDWMIGYEIAKNDKGIFRYVSDPPRDNASVASLQHYCPGMNVHYSSGIFNKAFYLLSNRPGWNIRKAFHVFITANTLYWKKDTDFADGACGAVKAAKDLGFCPEDVMSVFRDVDVEPCIKRRYNFQNLIDTYVSPEKKFQKYIDVSGTSDDVVTIEVHIEEGQEDKEAEQNVQYKLSVTFNGRDIINLKSNKTESVNLTDPNPGRYHITIEGEVPKMSVYVFTDVLFQQEISTNETNDYGLHGMANFNLDSTKSHPDFGVLIRVKGHHKNYYLFTRYGEMIDTHSWGFDINGRKLDELSRQALYCNSRPGLYSIVIFSYNQKKDNNFTVNAYRVFNLYPTTDF